MHVAVSSSKHTSTPTATVPVAHQQTILNTPRTKWLSLTVQSSGTRLGLNKAPWPFDCTGCDCCKSPSQITFSSRRLGFALPDPMTLQTIGRLGQDHAWYIQYRRVRAKHAKLCQPRVSSAVCTHILYHTDRHEQRKILAYPVFFC